MPHLRFKDPREFDIWSEGFAATGESGTATYHGTIKAHSFFEACNKFAEENPSFNNYYKSERLTYWGCRLYSNEQVARSTFG